MNQYDPIVLDVDDDEVAGDLEYRRRRLLNLPVEGGLEHGLEGFYSRNLEGKWVFGNKRCLAAGIKPIATVSEVPNIIAEDDMKEVIELCHAREVFPTYHMKKLPWMERSSQNGLNYCWAWGIGNCFMGTRALQYGWENSKEMAPVSLGWTVNWRNAGNYLGDAMEAMTTKGIAPMSYAKDQHGNSPRNFKDGWETAAHANTVKEWIDVDCRGGDMFTLRQLLTVLSTGRPAYIAHNWWSHALLICGLVWDPSKPFNVRIQHWNSHGDGLIELTGGRGVPDEAYAIVSTSAPTG